MLTSTFQHIRGISLRREMDLWKTGVLTWEAFEATLRQQLSLFPNPRQSILLQQLESSRSAWKKGDTAYFAERLPRREHYRLALSYPAQTLFLDIETTGLSRYYDRITIVGWSIGSEYDVHIAGQPDARLRKALSRAKVIVTFNGSIFDLPFLRSEFPALEIPSAHVDLRFLARAAGIGGPQKEVERMIGVHRDAKLSEIDGKMAPLLWHLYKRGDVSALKTLIRYNHADIEGMKWILDAAIGRLLQGLPRTLRPKGSFAALTSPVRLAEPASSKKGSIRVRRYQGEVGPAMRLTDLAVGGGSAARRIVGIDLTGSSERPSGWCLLVGDEASTSRLAHDSEILEATLTAKPDLVSIDSPLSLPRGRNSVSDDDPTRDQFGITRSCERILRSRGVNVYPSLIPSMQRLTARGIRLADTLRKRGIPVIESYPGAAQDILGIPRKRASLELLRDGLTQFGLQGHWADTQVSHDELDAITSAIVGVFFWAGRSEALGEWDESHLIVPDLEVDPRPWLSRRVVGISGPIAAGKTTAARRLQERGYRYGRFSQVLADLLTARGVAASRESLQQLGSEIHQSPGQRWLCAELVSRLPKEGNLVIDGLRHPEDYSYMVETFGPGFVHLFIDAPFETRLARYVEAGGSKAEFLAAASHPAEQDIDLMRNIAHRCINDARRVGDVRNATSASQSGVDA